MACGQHSPAEEERPVNPAAEGFNLEGSDPEAIALADSVMMAMGGRQAWDSLRFIWWDFFGARQLLWDKKTGRVRIDVPRDSSVYLVNINDLTGKVMEHGQEVNEPDTLADRLQRAKNMWINDSYWLFMPFKLKDSGVTLTYEGTDTMMTGQPAEVLRLRFENVGATPDNMYKVYIDPEDHLVYQWAYYRSFGQDSASAVWPWDNYKKYGNVLLSADRSDNRGPRNVKVFDEVGDSAFSSFEDPGL